MKLMFCWRCQMDMPMLDEAEYGTISILYSAGFSPSKEFREGHGLPLQGIPTREERFRPLLQKYHEMTGFEETEPNAVMHHRLSLYGPPCAACSKPLRSPQAAFCAACGETA